MFLFVSIFYTYTNKEIPQNPNLPHRFEVSVLPHTRKRLTNLFYPPFLSLSFQKNLGFSSLFLFNRRKIEKVLALIGRLPKKYFCEFSEVFLFSFKVVFLQPSGHQRGGH